MSTSGFYGPEILLFMKKSHLFLSGLFAVSAAVLSSCSSSESYVEYIPDDADVVMCADIKSIISDSRISENTKAIRTIGNYIDDTWLPEVADAVENILKDPDRESGLDIDGKVYCYGYVDNDFDYLAFKNINFVFGVRDAALLASNIKTLATPLIDDFAREDGKYVYQDYSTAIVLTDDFGIISVDFNYEEPQADDVLEAAEEANIKTVPVFRKMSGSNAAVWGFADLGEFSDAIMGEYEDIVNNLNVYIPELDDSYLCAEISFDESVCSISASTVLPSDERKRFEEEYSYIKKIDGSHFKYLSEDAVAVFASNMDWGSLVENFSLTDLMSAFGYSLVADVLASLDGEFTLGLNDLSLDSYGDLEDIDAIMISEVSGADYLDQVQSLLNADETGDDTYAIEVNDDLYLYYGVSGKNLYVSTSSDDESGLAKRKASFAGSKHAGKASGYSFIGIDVGGLRRILGDEIDDETAYLLSFIDYIHASNTSLTEQNITVTFNGKKNPLETAVDIFGDALNEM